jgi:hypothetical protein
MQRHLLLSLLFPLALAGSAFAADGPKDAVILVIRHAEKHEDGITLSGKGKDRADAYRKYFRHYEVDSRPLRLAAIYAAADSNGSERCRKTVEPLGKFLKVPVNARFANRDFLELADDVRAKWDGKHVLICWHHGEMPELLAALGAKPEEILPEGKWPDHVFDWVIQLSYDKDGNLVAGGAKLIHEHLMPNDPK